MYNLLASIILCLVANAAAAQCVAGTAAPTTQVRDGSGAGLIRTSAAMPGDSAPLRKAEGGDLIKTAATGPREVPAMRQPTTAPSQPKADAGGDDEQRRRAGPAMLLAAVAVMTAIALRRSGASGR